MGTSSGGGPRKKDQENQARDLKNFSQAIDNFAIAPQAGEISTVVGQPKTKSAVILIVDDTPDNLLVLFSYLEDRGYKVLLAEDGESALQIAQTQAPDLILLWLHLVEVRAFGN